MNYEIVIATSNQDKMKEYREMIKGLPITLYSLKDLNLNIEVEENFDNYFDNALAKAKAVAKIIDKPVLADDSGIEISFLGEHYPGVHTHRYADEHGGFPSVLNYILDKSKDVDNKEAVFCCHLAVLNITSKPLHFVGEAKGYIDSSIKGNNGFGYDPIFFSLDLNKNMGEATSKEKNKASHRGKAFKKFLVYLQINNLI